MDGTTETAEGAGLADVEPDRAELDDAGRDDGDQAGQDDDDQGDDQPDDQGDDQGDDQAEREPGGREAARYRRRLREAEAERDALAARLEAAQAAMVESLIEIKPEAFWAGGARVADLIDAQGAVDAERVKAAEADVRARFDLAARRGPRPDPTRGREPGPAGPTWQEILRSGGPDA